MLQNRLSQNDSCLAHGDAQANHVAILKVFEHLANFRLGDVV